MIPMTITVPPRRRCGKPLLLSAGSALVIAPNGYRLIHALQKLEIPAKQIGVTTSGNDRIVINGEERRFLEKRYQDAITKIGRKEK